VLLVSQENVGEIEIRRLAQQLERWWSVVEASLGCISGATATTGVRTPAVDAMHMLLPQLHAARGLGGPG
jgi:hypothetical protein